MISIARLRGHPVAGRRALAHLLRRHARVAAGRERARFEVWAGETCFAIWEPERAGDAVRAQKNAHQALHVDDVAAARAELESRGVEFGGETSTPACATWRSSPTPTATTSCCTAVTRPGRADMDYRARADLRPGLRRGPGEGLLRRPGRVQRRPRPPGQRRAALRPAHAARVGVLDRDRHRREREPSRGRSRACSSSSPTSRPRTPTCPGAASRSATSRTSRGAGSSSSATRTATAGRCSRSSRRPDGVDRREVLGHGRPAPARVG